MLQQLVRGQGKGKQNVRIEQGKEKNKEEGKKRKSERGLKKLIATILSFPRKDVRLWWL